MLSESGDNLIQVYQHSQYKIYKADNSFIIHNTDKEFPVGHTHLNSFKTAKYIIDMAMHKRIPHHLSAYLLISLIRVSDDTEYQRKILMLVENKTKKMAYYNKQGNNIRK